jgi:hypothetical protein
MNDDIAMSASERTALELLPWYVNGSLDGEEREQVRRELRSSLTCRLEYERLCRMQALMQAEDGEQAATDRGFERLMARIQADSRARPAAPPRPARWLPLAQAATLLALVGSAAWWLRDDGATQAGTFRTLTTEQPAVSQAPQLRLVFKPDVAGDERRALLAELGLRTIAAPTPDGIYTVALPAQADVRGLAERLRADPRIALVTTPPEGSDR